MKITGLNTYIQDGHQFVNVQVETNTPDIHQAIGSVLALFAGEPKSPPVVQQIAALVETGMAKVNLAGPAEATPPQEQQVTRTRTRKPAAAPTVEAAPTTQVASEEPAATAGRRRRVTDTAPVEAKPTISDADLSKACSNAAAHPGVGIGVVMQILNEDYGVKSANEVPADKREEFLKALAVEIELADAEAAVPA